MAWLLPVGTPGGIISGFEGIPAGSGIVRLGAQLIHADLATYRLWRAAAAAPQRKQLVAWGEAKGITEAEERIEALKEDGMIIEQKPDLPSPVGTLAVKLIGECLGNGGSPGQQFTVIGRSNTRLLVDAYLFEILLRSDGVSKVAALCDLLDGLRPEAGHRPCLDSLTDGMPMLVRNEVVILDGPLR
jgi:hypothetical protein